MFIYNANKSAIINTEYIRKVYIERDHEGSNKGWIVADLDGLSAGNAILFRGYMEDCTRHLCNLYKELNERRENQ